MISPQLRQQRLRRRPQLIAGAAQGHSDARLEHVAQLAEDHALRVLAQGHSDARLVTAQLRQRHRGARRGGDARSEGGQPGTFWPAFVQSYHPRACIEGV
eukprot:scaffold80203_cov73-Phaeocystis_antarctica.AAC.8